MNQLSDNGGQCSANLLAFAFGAGFGGITVGSSTPIGQAATELSMKPANLKLNTVKTLFCSQHQSPTVANLSAFDR